MLTRGLDHTFAFKQDVLIGTLQTGGFVEAGFTVCGTGLAGLGGGGEVVGGAGGGAVLLVQDVARLAGGAGVEVEAGQAGVQAGDALGAVEGEELWGAGGDALVGL